MTIYEEFLAVRRYMIEASQAHDILRNSPPEGETGEWNEILRASENSKKAAIQKYVSALAQHF